MMSPAPGIPADVDQEPRAANCRIRCSVLERRCRAARAQTARDACLGFVPDDAGLRPRATTCGSWLTSQVTERKLEANINQTV